MKASPSQKQSCFYLRTYIYLFVGLYVSLACSFDWVLGQRAFLLWSQFLSPILVVKGQPKANRSTDLAALLCPS